MDFFFSNLIHKSAYRVIKLQLLVTVAIAAVLGASRNLQHAFSALCGGGIAVFSAFVYARKMLTPGEVDPGKALKAQYRAELYKLAVTVVLFALVFSVFKNDIVASSLFLTYLATVIAYWFALVARN
ncbi:MAG TPA: ATP synthase subunit I [Rhodocyclaceae bacterium]|nr:ATP synthase subunit I [Rhodocyclaceae bacterium]